MDSTKYILTTLRQDITEHNLKLKAIIQVNLTFFFLFWNLKEMVHVFFFYYNRTSTHVRVHYRSFKFLIAWDVQKFQPLGNISINLVI